MNTLLIGLNPGGIVGMAPYFLKSWYAGRMDERDARNIRITGYDVGCDRQRATDDVLRVAPDVLGFSCYVWNVEEVLRICADVRAELPHTRIVLGGPEASPRALELMHKHSAVDAVAVGEGEITFAELLQRWAGGERDLSGVQGLVWRDGCEVRGNAARPVIQDLGEVPSPFLTGVVEFDRLTGYLFGYETFRGCPFTCSFCYWGRMLSVRWFPMERVRQELAVILKSSLRRMWLGDAVANLHRKRFKEFLRTVIDLDTDTIIDFEMVAELLDDETIDLMGQLHDGYVAFGLQSINDRALATITRKWKRDLFTRNVRALRRRTDKIKIYIDLIYGLPEDSPQTYEDGIRYVMSLLPQKIQPHPLLLLPGSPLFDNPQAFGIVYDEQAPHYVTENNWWSRADMQAAEKWNDKLFFYFNPAVNVTVIMASHILGEDPFDLFQRLSAFVAEQLDPTSVATDIGIPRELALRLNDVLEQFLVAELRDPRQRLYLAPLIDVMAFAGCKTMFYASDSAGPGARPGWLARGVSRPTLSPHVVVKRFAHDMSASYRNNILRSPEELLQCRPGTYDVVFSLHTHGIYHVSGHVSDLLAACSGKTSLVQLVEDLARNRNLALDERAHSVVRETFSNLARRQIVDLGWGVAV
jgi:uncharacterized Fe-S cluster-containing radical SAM superfamily protein